MSEKLIKIWVTKYALTSGIFEAMAEVEKNLKGLARIPKNYKTSESAQYFDVNDWHLSEKEAFKRAEEMKVKKIVSLEKQVKKIKSLNFIKEIKCQKNKH